MEFSVDIQSYKLKAPFRIAGKIWETSDALVVTATENGFTGRGEAQGVFYMYESAASIRAQVEDFLSDCPEFCTMAIVRECNDNIRAGAREFFMQLLYRQRKIQNHLWNKRSGFKVTAPFHLKKISFRHQQHIVFKSYQHTIVRVSHHGAPFKSIVQLRRTQE
jgi:hypothetical protein